MERTPTGALVMRRGVAAPTLLIDHGMYPGHQPETKELPKARQWSNRAALRKYMKRHPELSRTYVPFRVA